MRIDTIIHNASIRTLDPGRPFANAIGVFAGRIVGLDEELDGIDADERIDLGGAPVVPGFHDAHLHFSLLGQKLMKLDLSYDACPSLDAVYDAVRAAVATTEAGEWILGWGYDQNKVGAHPTLDVLDRIAPHRPVYLNHTSGHMSVANTAALHRVGADPDALPEVPGGNIGRGSDGRPTGLLQENAQSIVSRILLPVTLEQHRIGSRLASAWCVEHGITSITEPGVGDVGSIGTSPIEIRGYQDGVDAGEIDVRLSVMPYVTTLHDLGSVTGGDRWHGLDLGMRSGFGDERLRLSGVKILSDGSLIGRTAAMCCAFDDAPGNSGFLLWDEPELDELIVQAHRNGWQVATHAIGDRALDHCLDAFERARREHPRSDPRHRIEHCAVSRPDQIDRIVDLGVIPDPQGRFISETGDGLLAAVGPDRADFVYRMRTWVDRGIELPGSTDAPVVGGDPILSLHDMVNRRTSSGAPLGPAEALTPAQALRAYTVGSAYASHEERWKGTLARGKVADLVAVSDDLLTVAPDRIDSVTVGATIIGGRLVHDGGAVRGR